MKHFLFILFISFLVYCSSGASIQEDSLNNLLNKAKDDSVRINLLIDLFEYNKSIDFQLAEKYGLQALSIAQSSEDKKSEGNVLNKLGLLYTKYYQYDKGILSYLKASAVYEAMKDEEMIGVVYNNIGLNYGYRQEYGIELKYHYKALDLFNKIQDKSRQAMSYINIGKVYARIDDLDKALGYFEKARKMYDQLGDKRRLSICQNNIASIYAYQGKYLQAYENYRKALRLYRQLENRRGISMVLYNMTTPMLKLKMFDSTQIVLDQAMEMLKTDKDTAGLAICHNNLGMLQVELGAFDTAEKYFLLAYTEAEKTNQKELLLECNIQLSEVYQAKGDYKSALNYFKKFSLTNDSLRKNEIEKVKEAEKDYLDEKSRQEVKLLNKEKEIEKSQKKFTFTLGAFLISILFVVIYSLFRKYRNKKKSNQILAEKNILIEEKNKEITDSITYAKRIQNAILPNTNLLKTTLKDSFVLYIPKDIVAGDFYWLEYPHALQMSEEDTTLQHRDVVYFAVADCTGHGVPGAMVSVICHNALNRSVKEYGLTVPGEILDKTREIVVSEFEKSEEEVNDGMDIALCSMALKSHLEEKSIGVLKYAGANNPLWIITSSIDGREELDKTHLKSTHGGKYLVEIKADKQPVGKYLETKPFTTHSIELQSGDIIYIFSDGYADQFGGEKGKKFKSRTFKELLLEICEKPMAEQKEIIHNTFRNWKGSFEQVDDICIIGVKV